MALDRIERIRGALLGLAVGDALGVPVEFRPGFELAAEPVRGMRGYGTWNQPPGTWSDDSSLALCLAEGLLGGYDPRAAADLFVRWKRDAHWTARGQVFDIGRTTAIAIDRLRDPSLRPSEAGLMREEDNGNGSLMRILPLVLAIEGLPPRERIGRAFEVSSMTHAHPRSCIACVIYLETALGILQGKSGAAALAAMREVVLHEFKEEGELVHFKRVLVHDPARIPVGELSSSTYVVHSLETALHCVFGAGDFRDAVLRAVNFGGDADTIGAIAGGLAGLLHGVSAIPPEWLGVLARAEDIDRLARSLAEAWPGGAPPRS